MNAETLAELKRLAKRATPGPWEVDGTKALGAYFIWRSEGFGTADAQMICRLGYIEQSEWLKEVEKRTNDGNLIVALRNNVDAFIAAVERCAELECIADQLESTSECEVAWFDSMYRMIDCLGGKRGKSVPEDVEWAVVEAKRIKERCDELESERSRLHKAFSVLSGYAITCHRTNTRQWMFGLEDAINRAAALVGDPDRAVCDSDGMSMWLKKGIL